jgi:hypothetical protein
MAAYSAAAENPSAPHPFPTGRQFAESIGYTTEALNGIPDECVAAFAGVSNISMTRPFWNCCIGSWLWDGCRFANCGAQGWVEWSRYWHRLRRCDAGSEQRIRSQSVYSSAASYGNGHSGARNPSSNELNSRGSSGDIRWHLKTDPIYILLARPTDLCHDGVFFSVEHNRDRRVNLLVWGPGELPRTLGI